VSRDTIFSPFGDFVAPRSVPARSIASGETAKIGCFPELIPGHMRLLFACRRCAKGENRGKLAITSLDEGGSHE
jgi:hypothetical protein